MKTFLVTLNFPEFTKKPDIIIILPPNPNPHEDGGLGFFNKLGIKQLKKI